MRIFVTGATGALGTPTVAALVHAGHRVQALTRSDAAAAAVRAAGAEPVPGSLFEPEFLRSAVDGADAILHLATRIAPFNRARRRSAWLDNDRIRRDGTRNLVDAALAAGVATVVYPSFAPIYADGGSRWLSYGDPVEPTDILQSTVDAEAQVDRFTAAGGRGVVLRMAGVYGPHSPATRDVFAMARRGISGFVGPGRAYQPLVWDADVATALLTTVESAGVVGVFDVADDRPLTRAELARAVAAAVGRRSVRRPPTWLLRATLGRRMSFLLRSQRVSNRRFKDRTGWSPRVPDAVTGMLRLREARPDR
jgi:nucleoside-diphosphate-sugar epimerase